MDVDQGFVELVRVSDFGSVFSMASSCMTSGARQGGANRSMSKLRQRAQTCWSGAAGRSCQAARRTGSRQALPHPRGRDAGRCTRLNAAGLDEQQVDRHWALPKNGVHSAAPGEPPRHH